MAASLLSRLAAGLGLTSDDPVSEHGRRDARPRIQLPTATSGSDADDRSRPLAMIVSRDPASQKWGARWLERAGFDVEVPDIFTDIVGRCHELRPAVVLVEAQLGRGEGGRVYQALLDPCDDPSVPVVVLCSNNREVQAALETGAADIVSRPIDWRVVARRVVTLAESHRAMDRLGETMSKLEELEAAAKSARNELERSLRVDRLTGLPRRSAFVHLTDNLITGVSRTEGGVAVLHLDFDRFKAVNEARGREGGDEVLRQAARRLQSCLRSPQFEGWRGSGLTTAVAARLAGPEFALTVSSVSDPQRVAKFAQAILGSLCMPFMIDQDKVYLSTSIGVAASPGDGTDADTLLQRAERATVEAKRRGGGTCQFYDQSLNRVSERALEIDALLREALEEDKLELHYQPLVDFRSGRIVAAEALIRWFHPVLGQMAPLEFVPIAEETGLMVPVGTWVLRKACEQLASWINDGLPPIRMAVNIALCQLRKGKLAADVGMIVEETGVPPALLELELSERGVLRPDPEILSQLHELKSMGVRLSVDDFGSGDASIAYLRKFDLDVLKIDRSYVKHLEEENNDVAIASAIVAMAHRLRLAIVAEGVESSAQFETLRQWGCDEFQGFLFSPALPAHAFRKLLTRQGESHVGFDGCRPDRSGGDDDDS